MEQTQRPSRLTRALWYGVVAILVLVPFHGLLTTWAGSTFGHLDAWRIWKELLLAVLLPLTWWLYRQQPKRQSLKILNKLSIAYIVLHLGLGLLSLSAGRVSGEALAYALLVNLRFLGIFWLAYMAAAIIPLRPQWCRLLLWPAAVVVGFGLLQLVLPPDFLTHFGYGPETIPAIQTVDQKLEYRRLQSTLRGANPLGAYLVLVLTALGGLWLSRRPDRRWLSAYALVAATVLFFTYSRSAWLGTIISLVAVLYWSVKQARLRRVIVAATLGSMLLLGGAVWALRDQDRVQNTLFHSDETSQSAESSNAGRARSLKDGIVSVGHEPLGRGPGTAGPASVRNDQPARIAENYYIQLAQEVGLLGLALFLTINTLVAAQLWRQRQDTLSLLLLASLLGITFVNLLSHAWTDDTLTILWWALAGLALSSGGLHSSPAETGILKDKHEKVKEKTAT